MIKVTGLWEGRDKNDNLVLSGNLTPTSRVIILRNNFSREGKNDPDFFLHIDEHKKKEEEEGSKGE